MTNVQHLPRRLSAYPTPLEDVPEPFTAEINIEFPSPDGGEPGERHVFARTSQLWLHAASDTYDHVPVSAVFWPGIGENIELGPWSMSTDDALVLAAQLTRLVELSRKELHTGCNCPAPETLPTIDPDEIAW